MKLTDLEKKDQFLTFEMYVIYLKKLAKELIINDDHISYVRLLDYVRRPIDRGLEANGFEWMEKERR